MLGYYAPARSVKNKSDGYRAVKVELTDQAKADKVKLRYRTGYYASKH